MLNGSHLPILEKNEPTHTDLKSPQTDLNKEYVLVVEDDLCLETFLKRIIRSVDTELGVLWATSATGAQRILMSHAPEQFRLIIVDYHLEGRKTGFEFWKTCARHYPAIPYVFMSGLESDKYLRFMAYYGQCPQFVKKPFTAQHFRKVVESLIMRRI